MNAATIVRLVAIREIRERLRNRAFLLSNIITIVIILGAIIAIPLFFEDDPIRIGVTGDVPAEVRASIEASITSFGEEVEVRDVTDPGTGEMLVLDGEVDALLVGLDELVVESEAPTLVEFAVGRSIIDYRLAQGLAAEGIADEVAAITTAASEPVPVRALDPRDENFFTGFGAASLGVVLLFMGITFYGGTVLTGVLEEKTNRVVEVIMATVRPWQLLAGKVLGLGLLGLAQMALLVGLGLGGAVATDLTEVPPSAFASAGWVVVWFVLGFAFYSVLYAMGGSLAGRLEDAQSTAAPTGLLVLFGYLLSFVAVIPNPESGVATVLSLLPPVAPFAMPALIALGEAAAWQVALAIALMVVSIGLAVRLAGRIYAGAVLHTGERVKIRDAWRLADDVTA